MQYRKLGRTGLMVSEVCLGTMTFGTQVDEKEANHIITHACSAGVNFIDTADQYGDGKSEEAVGKALKGNRGSVVLATKIGNWKSGPGVTDTGLSRKHIMREVENSLNRLQTDYIDLYYAHRPDYTTPMEETLRAFDDLIRQGKVRYIACSNFRAWQLTKALYLGALHGLTRYECIQSPYNLITRDLEYEVLPLCAEEEVSLCAYNPLAGGFLTGKYDRRELPHEGRFTLERLGPIYKGRYWSEKNFEAVKSLKQIAKRHNRSAAQIALAWLFNNKSVTSVLLGVSSVKQLEENLNSTEVKLNAKDLKECEKIWQKIVPGRSMYGR